MAAQQHHRIDMAGLAVLIILQGLMLGSLYTLTEPHPPVAIPLFALAPFLSASIALAGAALILDPSGSRLGRATTICAVATALVSFGPQKWIDPSIAQIWPAVGLAQIFCVVLLVRAIGRAARSRDPARDDAAWNPPAPRTEGAPTMRKRTAIACTAVSLVLTGGIAGFFYA